MAAHGGSLPAARRLLRRTHEAATRRSCAPSSRASCARNSVKPRCRHEHLTTGCAERSSVVDVDVSPDLTSAAVVVSIFSDDELENREAFSWLVRNRTPLRRDRAPDAHRKRVPERAFKRADISQAVEMMALIEKVRADERARRARRRRSRSGIIDGLDFDADEDRRLRGRVRGLAPAARGDDAALEWAAGRAADGARRISRIADAALAVARARLATPRPRGALAGSPTLEAAADPFDVGGAAFGLAIDGALASGVDPPRSSRRRRGDRAAAFGADDDDLDFASVAVAPPPRAPPPPPRARRTEGRTTRTRGRRWTTLEEEIKAMLLDDGRRPVLADVRRDRRGGATRARRDAAHGRVGDMYALSPPAPRSPEAPPPAPFPGLVRRARSLRVCAQLAQRGLRRGVAIGALRRHYVCDGALPTTGSCGTSFRRRPGADCRARRAPRTRGRLMAPAMRAPPPLPPPMARDAITTASAEFVHADLDRDRAPCARGYPASAAAAKPSAKPSACIASSAPTSASMLSPAGAARAPAAAGMLHAVVGDAPLARLGDMRAFQYANTTRRTA